VLKIFEPQKLSETGCVPGGENLKRESKTRTRKGCSEEPEEERKNALLDYEDIAEVTASGTYQCRDCGMLFEPDSLATFFRLLFSASGCVS
jgi:hypothetical protein